METKWFSDFTVGETIESHGRTITEADQVNFAGIGGNFHQMHLDEEYMEESSYGRRLVFGLLLLAIAEGLRTQLGFLDESAMAYYGIDDVRFTSPVFIGDTVHNRMTVVDKEERDEESGIVTLREEIVARDDEIALVAESRLLVRKQHD